MLSKDEALTLLLSKSEDIFDIACEIRERSYGRIITYSRKIFIPVTTLCKDECYYCDYKKEPWQGGNFIDEDQAYRLIKIGKSLGCREVLLVTGEKPELKYWEAKEFLKKKGYKTTIDYVKHLAKIALSEGMLPHTNVGLMTQEEMLELKKVTASMGLMLETTAELSSKGMAHERAPSKNPRVRIKVLEEAGKLSIPFTTGILVGIGETPKDVVDSLYTIKQLHDKYGHIQEVIIQNFKPKPGTVMGNWPEPSYEYMRRIIAVARLIFEDKISVQAPPNLAPNVMSIVSAGANDLGGISPLTPDYVNIQYPWPSIKKIEEELKNNGFVLKERLAVYDSFINPKFVEEDVLEVINKYLK